MMVSAASAVSKPLVGLIMTGMGKDGLQGLRLIKKKGGCVIAQNEQTCIIYGMPKAAVDDGIADYVLPLEQDLCSLTDDRRRKEAKYMYDSDQEKECQIFDLKNQGKCPLRCETSL